VSEESLATKKPSIAKHAAKIDLVHQLVGQFAEDSSIRYWKFHQTTASLEKFQDEIADARKRS
jgi:hypothetical protein